MSSPLNDSSAAATAAHVTREANLIARNLACHGAAVAAAETADHIRRFWAPQLRAVLLDQALAHPERFSRIASDAIATLDPQMAGPSDDRGSVYFRMKRAVGTT